MDRCSLFTCAKVVMIKKVRDLVMLINGSGDNDDKDTVFLIISGDIDLNQISKLTKMMNVPGQKQIEDATN